MKHLSTNTIRKLFLDYFEANAHTFVPSSSLVPADDPTLLFVNAGMVQFKETFLGIEQRPYQRATSSQRCVRAGGKHNDLENVGYTKRHHTFFEMLGNFSFGDYFKREAIKLAWVFVTEYLAIPTERLWVSVFTDDQESEAIWLQDIGLEPTHLVRCGEKDNFWQMGDTGPCGPCTEIFYDHGPSIPGGPPGSPEADGDRYVELWNIVFMQFERDSSGKLQSLPKPCVDTGMGLERVAAVMQGVHDNYDIDLFQSLLKALQRIIGENDTSNKSMRVIVDHIRSVAFLIVDGVIPSNEGRGYVLRRIMRRAIRHGVKLGQKQAFFYKMVAPLVDAMGEAFPELTKAKALVEQVIKQEETQFSKTLSRGLKILDQEIDALSSTVISGDLVFQLYDTYGFPPDLTADIARERGLTYDQAGFDQAMQRQREQSHKSQRFYVDQTSRVHLDAPTEFVGYEFTSCKTSVLALLEESALPVTTLNAGQSGVVVLEKTPFYAESGGQVGDRGELHFEGGVFSVVDTIKQGDSHAHVGKVLKGELNVKDEVSACVDFANRQAIRSNHSATHLLHAALRTVLGEHAQQKGSLVSAEKLRFDFAHHTALTRDQIDAVERRVNQQIRANVAAVTESSTPEAAKASGAVAIFGERYGSTVRVLKLGEFSTEICGGTHVSRTGDIGFFKITSEGACASGVRRLEAVTGEYALMVCEQASQQLEELASLLKTDSANLVTKIAQLIQQNRRLEQELSAAKQHSANRQLTLLEDAAVEIMGIKVLAAELKGVDRETLRNTLDQLKSKLTNAAILLATTVEDKIQIVATVSKSCLQHFNATDLLNQVAHQVGGKGGGRPEMAQGGGTIPAALPEALKSVTPWAKKRIIE